MSETSKLKDRFSKLQVKFFSPEEKAEALPAPSHTTIELAASAHRELHQTLREVSGAKVNWKNALRKSTKKLVVTSKNGEAFLAVERTLQKLSPNPILVAVCATREKDASVLNRLSLFLQEQALLFQDLFQADSVCLIRVVKNRAVLELNIFSGNMSETMRSRFEKESTRRGSFLTSYQIDVKDGWLSMSLNISETPVRSFEEMSQ